MSVYRRLQKRQQNGCIINVAVSGAGLIGRGTVRQIEVTPAMRTALIINRSIEPAVEAYKAAGISADTIEVSDNLRQLQIAIDRGRPAITTRLDVLEDLQGIDIAVEVTGAVEHGARMALHAIAGGKHVIMMNAETDATVGCALKQLADDAGVIYSNSDGDQPGVLMRLIDYVQCLGFEIVAAVNCKGFMDVNATPESIKPWAIKQNTSLAMTTAFTDGTKMNIENCVVCNATGLTPEVRGMHGLRTDLPTVLNDCIKAFGKRGVVDYTLGGSFGGGVFVIGHCEESSMVQPLMKYLKMGDGPDYLFYRPYHLCHFETPISIAEAVLDHEPTIAPLGEPITEVVAIAKRDIQAGETLDGIGGYTVYGQIDCAQNARDLLPIGLSDGLRINQTIQRGQPIPMSACELKSENLLLQLRQHQLPQFSSAANRLILNGSGMGSSPRRAKRAGMVANDRLARFRQDDGHSIKSQRTFAVGRKFLKL
jgi:predicted homoserine dehydrogenase-like protein